MHTGYENWMCQVQEPPQNLQKKVGVNGGVSTESFKPQNMNQANHLNGYIPPRNPGLLGDYSRPQYLWSSGVCNQTVRPFNYQSGILRNQQQKNYCPDWNNMGYRNDVTQPQPVNYTNQKSQENASQQAPRIRVRDVNSLNNTVQTSATTMTAVQKSQFDCFNQRPTQQLNVEHANYIPSLFEVNPFHPPQMPRPPKPPSGQERMGNLYQKQPGSQYDVDNGLNDPQEKFSSLSVIQALVSRFNQGNVPPPAEPQQNLQTVNNVPKSSDYTLQGLLRNNGSAVQSSYRNPPPPYLSNPQENISPPVSRECPQPRFEPISPPAVNNSPVQSNQPIRVKAVISVPDISRTNQSVPCKRNATSSSVVKNTSETAELVPESVPLSTVTSNGGCLKVKDEPDFSLNDNSVEIVIETVKFEGIPENPSQAIPDANPSNACIDKDKNTDKAKHKDIQTDKATHKDVQRDKDKPEDRDTDKNIPEDINADKDTQEDLNTDKNVLEDTDEDVVEDVDEDIDEEINTDKDKTSESSEKRSPHPTRTVSQTEDVITLGEIKANPRETNYKCQINREKLDKLIKFLQTKDKTLKKYREDEPSRDAKVKTNKPEETQKEQAEDKSKGANEAKKPNHESRVSGKTQRLKKKAKSDKTPETKSSENKEKAGGNVTAEERQSACNANQDEKANPTVKNEITVVSWPQSPVDVEQLHKDINQMQKNTAGAAARVSNVRIFPNFNYHFCNSCTLVSPIESFWINAVTGELKCLNCFKRMNLNTVETVHVFKDRAETETTKEGSPRIDSEKTRRESISKEEKRRRVEDADKKEKRRKSSDKPELSSNKIKIHIKKNLSTDECQISGEDRPGKFSVDYIRECRKTETDVGKKRLSSKEDHYPRKIRLIRESEEELEKLKQTMERYKKVIEDESERKKRGDNRATKPLENCECVKNTPEKDMKPLKEKQNTKTPEKDRKRTRREKKKNSEKKTTARKDCESEKSNESISDMIEIFAMRKVGEDEKVGEHNARFKKTSRKVAGENPKNNSDSPT